MLRALLRFFTGTARRQRRHAVVEECEPRILYSADLNPVLWADAGTAAEVRLVAPPVAASAPAAAQSPAEAQRRSHEIVFVDANVPDAQALIDAVLAARGAQADIEIVNLAGNADGLQQITDVLGQEQDLDAIHIISHGSAGQLQLGSGMVNAQTLSAAADSLGAWRAALSADADILLYGCDVAAGVSGQAFIQQLAQATGADVAASTDATGSAARGGDWVLETETGRIEAQLAITASAFELSWSGLLSLTPQGSETRVNTDANNSQTTTVYGGGNVAMDSAGNTVVVWNDARTNSGDVYFQRYNAAGVAQGGNVLVNTTTANLQAEANVAMDANGNFVVVWSSDAQDGSGLGIYAQRYNASGVAQGAEFRVNFITVNAQQNPAVAMDASGNFVVTWTDSAADSFTSGVYAQRYNNAGVAQGSAFRVNTTIAGAQTDPVIAMNAGGSFVIAWQSTGQDGSGIGIYAQRFNSAGVAQGGEILANGTTSGDQWHPSIAMDTTGGFVVVWEDVNGADGSSNGIFGRRFDASGVAQGGEFRVNTTTADQQTAPAVGMNAAGGFVVTWQSLNQDGGGTGVYAQRFDLSGVAQGSQTLVNTTTANDQRSASVAYVGSGVVVAWQGNGTGDSEGVFMQRFSTPATAPVVTTTGTTLAYTENGAATAVDSALTVSDTDSTNLTGATVSISANFASGQDVLAFTNQLGITGSWNAGTGVLTLSGTTTLANYQAALRSITYVNTSDAPGSSTRTVSFVVNDGTANSTAATRNISVAAVNDAPQHRRRRHRAG